MLSAAARDAAGSIEGARFVPLGTRRLRNASEPVGLYAAMRHPAAAQLTQMLDPACRMAIAPGREAGRITLDDTEYVFCSADCADRFAADPSAYTLRHREL